MDKKQLIILLIALLAGNIAMQAQMTTDNSYLRENYNNSKTAKKAAARKAARKARREQKDIKEQSLKEAKGNATHYVKAKDGSVTTKEKAAERDIEMDTPYLAGAVPTTTEGIVCFERTFDNCGKAKQQAFDIMKDAALEIINSPKSAREISRIMSEEADTLIATICEPIYFKKAKWETDSALIRYQYIATAGEINSTLRVWLISYSYEEIGFGYKAEVWITDKYALTKDKQALRKGSGKFRKKTIDYVNELFARIEDRLKNPD